MTKKHLTATGGTLIIMQRKGALFINLLSLIMLVLYSMSLFVCSLQEVRFTLDRCAGAAVMEMEGLGSWLTTEDHSSCEVTGTTPNTDRYTHMHTSLIERLAIQCVCVRVNKFAFFLNLIYFIKT